MLWQRANNLTLAGEPIAGFRLHPPTVGHALLLSDLGVDLMAPDSHADMLLVCFALAHRTAKEAHRDLSAWWCPMFMRFYGWAVGRFGNPERDAERFSQFVAANNDGPETVSTNGKPRREMGSPWQWRLFTALVAECGMTRQEAEDTPILDAQMLTACLGEMRGAVEIWSDRDEAFHRWCEEQDRKKANGTVQSTGEAGA